MRQLSVKTKHKNLLRHNSDNPYLATSLRAMRHFCAETKHTILLRPLPGDIPESNEALLRRDQSHAHDSAEILSKDSLHGDIPDIPKSNEAELCRDQAHNSTETLTWQYP